MNTERLIRVIAGALILLSLLLAHLYNGASLTAGPTWLWFTAFVGANLLQSGLTRWCLMEKILLALGIKSGCVAMQAGPGK